MKLKFGIVNLACVWYQQCGCSWSLLFHEWTAVWSKHMLARTCTPACLGTQC